MKTYKRINVRSNRTINPNWSGGKIIGPKGILTHHDAQIAPATYSSLARYESHARLHNNWGYGTIGMQYDIRIDNAGQVWLSREFEKILYHAGSWPVNQRNIAICLDGYFHAPHNQQPTREQYEALIQTLDWLRGVFGISRGNITGHRQHSGTVCPGDVLYPFVVAYRKGTPSIPKSAKYAFPDWQPKPEPKPKPKPPSVKLTKTDKYSPTKKMVFSKDASLVNIPQNTKAKVSGKVDYKKGEVVENIAEMRTYSDGKRFYRTAYSVKNKVMRGFGVSTLDEVVKPKPIPEPPKPKPADPEYKKNTDTKDLPQLYVTTSGDVSLRNIGTRKVVSTQYGDTFPDKHELTMVLRTTDANGQKWLLTEYSVDKDLWNGVKEDELRPKTIDDKPADHEHDLGDIPERLSKLEELVDKIVQFLKSIFKNFKE